MKTHKSLISTGLIPLYDKNLKQKTKMFYQVLTGDVVTGFKMIMLLNSEDKVG
jgi:hypothetical protein